MASSDDWDDPRGRLDSLSQLSELASQTPPLVTSSASATHKAGLSPFLTTAAAFANSPFFEANTPASPLSIIRHGFPRPNTSLRRNLAESNALRYEASERDQGGPDAEEPRANRSTSNNNGGGGSGSSARRANGQQRRSAEDAAPSDEDDDAEEAAGSRQWKKAKVQRGAPAANKNRSSSTRAKGAKSARKSAAAKNGTYDRSASAGEGAAGSRSAPPKTKTLKSLVSGITETGKIRSQHRGAWTPDEDELLIKLVRRSGASGWTQIAADLGTGRNGRQCRERWSNQINPDLVRAKWSDEEDVVILRAHAEIGNRWATIAKLLPGRTDNMVKNRFNGSLLPKEVRKARERGEVPPKIMQKVKSADKRKSAEFSEETLALAERLKERAVPADEAQPKPSTRGKPARARPVPTSPDTEPPTDFNASDKNSDDEGSTGAGSASGPAAGSSSSSRKSTLPVSRSSSASGGSQAGSSSSSSRANGTSASRSSRSAGGTTKRGTKRRSSAKQRPGAASAVDEVSDVMAQAEATTSVAQRLIQGRKVAHQLAHHQHPVTSTLAQDLKSPERAGHLLEWLSKASPGSLATATPQQTFGIDGRNDLDVNSSRELFKSDRPLAAALEANFELGGTGVGSDAITASPMPNFLGLSPLRTTIDSPADLRRAGRVDGLTGKRRLLGSISSGFSDILNGDTVAAKRPRRFHLLQQSPATDDALARFSLSTPRGSGRLMASTPLTVSSDFGGADSLLGGSVVKHTEMMQRLAALSSVKRDLGDTDMQGLRDPSRVRRALEDDVSPSNSPAPDAVRDALAEVNKLRDSTTVSRSLQAENNNQEGNNHRNTNAKIPKNGDRDCLEAKSGFEAVTATRGAPASPADDALQESSKKKRGLDRSALDREDGLETDPKQEGNDAGAAESESRSSNSSPDPAAMQGVTYSGKESWDISEVPCKCRRSKCLKLYCTCFAGEMHCGSFCQCMACCNREGNARWRKAALLAEEKKLVSDPPRQCRCRNSQCLKKYCECFRAGSKCGSLCKCCDCQNTDAHGAVVSSASSAGVDHADASSLESSCTEDSNSREALELIRQDQQAQTKAGRSDEARLRFGNSLQATV